MRSAAAIIVTMASVGVASCERAQQAKPSEPEPLVIQYWVGGTWNPGYSLQVNYDHLTLESPRCSMAKEGRGGIGPDKGFCVVRISEKQWENFVRAVEPYREQAIAFDPAKIIDRPFT